MRTGAEASYALTDFQIRVHSVGEARRASAEATDGHLLRSLAPWAGATEEALVSDLEGVPRDVPGLIRLARDGDPTDGSDATPWFDAHVAATDRSLMFAEHEAVDHPAAVMFVVSSTAADPVAAALALERDPDSWPPVMRSEAANPDVPRHYVLLHDASRREHGDGGITEGGPEGSGERSSVPGDDDDGKRAAEAKAQALRAAYGAGAVSVVTINSGRPGSTPPVDVWSDHAEVRVVRSSSPVAGSSSASVRRGALFSDADVAGHRAFVAEYVALALLPQMEARVRALNATIAATRKGLKNQLKSFWGRSTGVKAKPEGDGGYTHAAAESQIRVAADLAFALRDYETAASHYRLLQGDYKADKAWRRLGAVNEALGQALVMCRPGAWSAEGPPYRDVRRDAEAALEAAATCYQRAAVTGARAAAAEGGGDGSRAVGDGSNLGDLGDAWDVAERTRWVTKAALSHAALLRACHAHREVPAPLMRASAEESQTHLRAAHLLEASALAYLRADPPMPRKFAIHLVLAGHRFNQAQQRAHAIRCYARALPVYQHAGPPLASLAAGWNHRGGAPSDEDGKERLATHLGAKAENVNPGWARAQEHLHFALGRQVAHSGALQTAGAYFRQLLEVAHQQPATLQATYLREYLYVAQKAAEAAAAKIGEEGAAPSTPEPTERGKLLGGTEIDGALHLDAGTEEGLPLPSFDVGNPRVHLQDGRDRRAAAAPSGASAGVGGEASAEMAGALRVVSESGTSTTFAPPCASWPEARWAALEEDGLVPAGLQGGGATWLDKPRERGAEQRGVCAAGEEVVVEVAMSNPLKVAIDVTHLRLVCEFVPAEGDDDLSSASSALVSTPTEATSLQPGERTKARLRCTPRRAGTLRIVGVAWTLCGAQRGFRRFDPRAPRTRRGANGEWARDAPREKRLAFTVTPVMPRLSLVLEGLPSSVPAGSATLATLRIRNVTSVAAHNVRLRLPGRGLAVPADDELSKEASTTPRGDGSVLAPPAWRHLAAGAEVSLELWIHPDVAGVLDVPLAVCYEPPPPAPALLRVRTARLAAGARVVPSLDVSAAVYPSASHPAARVIRLTATAARQSAAATSAPSYALRAVTLVRSFTNGDGGHRGGLSVRALGAASGAPRVIAPGERWDTVLQVDPDGSAPAEKRSNANTNAAADATERGSIPEAVATVTFGSAGGAPSGPTPPVVALHAAAARPVGGGVGFGVLDGVDVIVEWEEVRRGAGASGADGAVVRGAHHLRDVAAPDAAASRSGAGRATAAASNREHDVRWTLEGPATVTFPKNAGDTSGSATMRATVVPITLRAHNPSPRHVRFTFESLAVAERRADASRSGGGWRSISGAAGWADPGVAAQSAPPPSQTSAAGQNVGQIVGEKVRSLPAGRAWTWTGPVKKTVTIAPGATEDLPLRVSTFAPGTYAIGDYRVSWEAAAAAGGGGGGGGGGGAAAAAAAGRESGTASSVGERCVRHPAQASNAPFVVSVTEAASA